MRTKKKTGAIDPVVLRSEVVTRLKRPKDIGVLAEELNVKRSVIAGELRALKQNGYQIDRVGDIITLHRTVAQSGAVSPVTQLLKKTGETRFGIISDTHLGSKFERLDILEAAYDHFAKTGITEVYHAGNLVDGESVVNRYDLKVHGLVDQTHYALDHYPQRKGITTHFIDGDDHEGWWTRREGIRFGPYLEMAAREVDRTDLRYLGYAEADVKLSAPWMKKPAIMRITHPGGGSAYATSYKAQKTVECVPLDTDILTRRGWKRPGDLIIGEEVMGFNTETRRCEWTPLQDIHTGTAEVVHYESKQFRIRCTRNHKWALERYLGNYKVRKPRSPRCENTTLTHELGTVDDALTRSYIVQAAPACDGPGVAFTGRTDYMNREDAVAKVLEMTTVERRAFIYGLLMGEGSVNYIHGKWPSVVFSQNPGPVLDAFVLACHLEGMACGQHRRVTKKINGDEKVNCRVTVMSKSRRLVDSLVEVGSTNERVWCPQTKLGTWVMRQGSHISITGNSYGPNEKPDILVVGHYHKMGVFRPRSVWSILAGCTQDQSTFMRKLGLEAHLGWLTVGVSQDKNGAAIGLNVQMFQGFDRAYYK